MSFMGNNMPNIEDLLPVGGVGVDVGAEPDKDDWTGRMLERVGTDGKVVAFEPDPDKFRRLFELYGSSDNAVLEQKAVSDTDGMVNLTKSGTHYSLSPSGGNLDVTGVRLDSYFPEGSVVDCLKIDTEGGEYCILQGSKRLIRGNPQIRVVLELHLGRLQERGISAGDVYSLLSEMDLYVGWRFGEPLTDLAGIGEGYSLVCWRKGG